MADFFDLSYFALFFIIALGIIIGKIKIRNISFDISAVIFVSLFLGHHGVLIPADFQYIGLILFIFTVGIQAGPGFFGAFKSKGMKLVTVAALLVMVAALTTFLLAYLFNIDKEVAVGLLTGALTSTPGLAAAIDKADPSLTTIGYGIAYPFGIIGVILVARFMPYLLRADIKKAEEELKKEEKNVYPDIVNRHFIVENENIFGKTISELRIRSMTGASISRVMQNGKTITPTPRTVLNKGDLVKAVCTDEALEKVKLLIGHETDRQIPRDDNLEIQSVLVTNKDVVNKTIGELNLLSNHNATITRIRRSGIDITPSASSQIRFGDKLMIVTNRENMNDVTNLFGDEDKKLSDTNFFPVAAGVVLGILFGRINIQFGESFSFSPGLSGGVLFVALVLGYIGKTGPVVWSMSGSANQLLRQLGLLLFLATVGTHAGSHIVATITEYGLKMFYAGILITVVPMVVSAFFAHKILKINVLSIFGTLAGGMTSTPALVAVEPITESNEPQVAYATVYPIAMVLIIVCVQIMVMI